MRKNKLFSIINIVGLALGLSASLLIMLWVQDELSFDGFHRDAPRIHRVIQHIRFEEEVNWAITQGPLGPSLKQEVPEIIDYCRFEPTRWRIIWNGQTFMEPGAYVDPSFFRMFTFPLVRGDSRTALDEIHSVVLTRSFAEKVFGQEDPVGKTINLANSRDLLVTGVVSDPPPNSHLQFNFLGTMDLAKEVGLTVERWNNSTFYTYVMLAETSTRELVVGKIENFLDEKPTLEEFARLDLQPMREIHFGKDIDFDQAGTGNFKYVIIFSIAAALILLIACINFMNLATAQSASRAREIGLRKVLGAQRLRLIGQYLIESLSYAFLAAMVTVILVAAILPFFNELSGKDFEPGILGQSWILVSIVFMVIFTGLAAGSYPAIVISALQPAHTLRGIWVPSRRGNRFRTILVIFQFTASVILLIGTIVIYGQIHFLQSKDLGYDKENLVCLKIYNRVRPNYETIKLELQRHPGVAAVTGSSSLPTYGYQFSNSLWHWEGQTPDKETLIRAEYVDYDYVKAMGMGLSVGRDFSREMSADTDAIIINEAARDVMGMDNPLGQRINYNNDREYNVIGVVGNYNFRSLHTGIEPLVLILRPGNVFNLMVRLKPGNPKPVIVYMAELWRTFAPDYPFEYSFLDERLEELYRTEQRIGGIVTAFSGLAVAVSCLGLFGLASFMVIRRKKEIGIRKVLGAGTARIVMLFLREYSGWILLANVIGWPVSVLFLERWLNTFAYRISIEYWMFILAAGVTLFCALVTVGHQAFRAARANPADSIGRE
jgi:ABC-type antimicrobial peptide transport system permease subunit